MEEIFLNLKKKEPTHLMVTDKSISFKTRNAMMPAVAIYILHCNGCPEAVR